MREYKLCTRKHQEDETSVCVLCHKQVFLNAKHYVRSDNAMRVAMHVECALAAVLDTESNV